MKRHDVSSRSAVAPESTGGADRLEMLIHRLIRHAARSVPPSLAERLEEEWLADLAARRGALSRLRFAAGCCWASLVITRELGATVKVAAPAPSGRAATLYPQSGLSLLSPRATAILLILLLHALVIYALATGFGARVVRDIAQPLKVTFLPQPQRAVELPPPPRPDFVRPRVDLVPPPEIPFDTTAGSAAQTITVVEGSTPPPPPTSKSVSRAVGGPGVGFPNTEDYYPAASKRLGEKGVATIRVCVDAVGRLTAVPVIAQSSGSERLDDGALRLARAGSGHYRATTEDGKPVSSCYPYRIRFELRN
jgi:periplasmic protein TonB